MSQDPIKLFGEWYAKAQTTEQSQDPTLMFLATATKEGNPSVRPVLLKAFDERGFVFYTNLKSRKAQELTINPQAALCFFWPTLDRQVRIEGKAELVSDKEADAYFATRARGSQIGAWASLQSQALANPEMLQARVKEYEKQFESKPVPRPENWSGFRLIPARIEFWKRGDFRLHERVSYSKNSQGEWQIMYLYP